MRSTKKTVLICLCVVAVLSAAVIGTLAWLADRDSVVNTFTVGQVDITVDETAVNEDGTPIEDAERVKENTYHLLPGLSYTKDPMVTVKANSEDSYVRMILTVHNAAAVQAILDEYELGDYSVFLGGWDPETWIYQDFTEDTEANTISFEFRYKEIVARGEEDAALPPLFDTLIVPGEVSGEEMKSLYDGGFKMEIFGHAIQAGGFDTEDFAWESFDKQLDA